MIINYNGLLIIVVHINHCLANIEIDNTLFL